MDGLVSLSIEQVWASSSSSAGAYTTTNYGYSSRSHWPLPQHHHSALPHVPPSSDSSTVGSRNAVLRHQHASSPSEATLTVPVVQIESSSSSSGSSNTAAVREPLFEPLDAGTGRDYRDQAMQPAGQPIPISSARHRSLPAALPTSNSNTRTRTRASSSSHASSSMRMLQRTHSAGGYSSSFLSSTAGHLLSSLGGLGGLSRMSSSPVAHARQATLGASRAALRQDLLLRSPAVLLDQPGGSSSESYDDLLALDQFNVKRAVKPTVLARMPTRGAREADRQHAAQCFICFEPWRPPAAAAAAAAAPIVSVEDVGVGAWEATAGVCGSAAPSSCRCRCHASNAAGVNGGTARLQSTAVGGAVVVNIVAVQQHQQQQQQQQQRLGCFGSWGAGMFRQLPAPTSSSAATAAAASGSSGAAAHVDLMYNSSSIRDQDSCRCSCGSKALQAAVAKPAPPVMILQLPCSHEFCVGCISTWLAEHVTCPICRWSFPEAHTQLINLHK